MSLMEEYTIRRKTSNSSNQVLMQDYDSKPKPSVNKVLNMEDRRANNEIRPEDFAENKKTVIKKQDQNNILVNSLLFLLFLSSLAVLANQIKLSQSSTQKIEILNRDTSSIRENLVEINDSLKQLKSELSFQRERQLKQESNYQKELLQRSRK